MITVDKIRDKVALYSFMDNVSPSEDEVTRMISIIESNFILRRTWEQHLVSFSAGWEAAIRFAQEENE